MSKISTLICLSLLAGGCSTARVVENPGSPVENSAVSAIATASSGSTILIDGMNYQVVDVYTAASGRQCKKLIGSGDIIRVSCRSSDGSWYVRDALSGRTAVPTPAFVPPTVKNTSAQNNSSRIGVEDNGVDLSEIVTLDDKRSTETAASVRMNSDETLWKFSRRVTGTGTNWQAIADYNDVTDVTSLNAGDVLEIPPGMRVLAGIEN